MIWISAEDVILIHSRVIEGSGGLDGLRDRDGLEAAVSAPMQTFDGKELYPTDLEKIARLGFGLASNHAFVDGNKRIGMYVMLTFLEVNGIRLDCTNNEIVEVGLAVASGAMDYDALLKWVRSHRL